MGRKLAVIKIGGRVAEEGPTLGFLLDDMVALAKDWRWVLVHGGGQEVTRVSSVFGLEARFRDGIRLTSPQEMPVVDMVLRGQINAQLVRQLGARGVRAVGLGGHDALSVLGRPVMTAEVPDCRTAEVEEVQTDLLRLLLKRNFWPVLCSVATDRSGKALNINADSLALAVATALEAHRLVFLSDVPGVLVDGDPLPRLGEKLGRRLVEEGKITGGMVPKVGSALQAVKAGVGGVVIGRYAAKGDLVSLLKAQKGTLIR